MPKLAGLELLDATHSFFSEILKNYGLKLISFEIPSKGTKNTTAVARTNNGFFVLRVYRKNKRDEEILNELKFMAYLKDNGIPIPRVIPHEKQGIIFKYKKDGVAWNCILMEFLPGKHPKTYPRERLRILAENQARMHQLGIEYGKMHVYRGAVMNVLKDEQFFPHLDFKKITEPDIKDFLERARHFSLKLDGGLPGGFNQLDYARGNLLLVGKKLTGVLDFDDLTYSPTAVCLGYALWNVLYVTNNPAKPREYLESYSKIRKLAEEEVFNLRDIMLFRNYAIGAMEVLFRGEGSAMMPKFLSWEEIIPTLIF